MNRKGFTLIELMMVIALIAVLSLILIPNIVTVIDKNNIEACKDIEENIKKAAKEYAITNKYDLGFTCSENKEVSLNYLIENGYLTNLNINPVTKEEINKDAIVNISYDCTSKTFSYEFDLNCES